MLTRLAGAVEKRSYRAAHREVVFPIIGDRVAMAMTGGGGG